MRGENPNSFPIRLFPENPLRLTPENYPIRQLDINKKTKFPITVSDGDRTGMSKLPIVCSPCPPGTQFSKVLVSLTDSKVRAGGTGYQVIDSLLQAGNCVFPVKGSNIHPESYVGNAGFSEVFKKTERGAVRALDASWLATDTIGAYSPKLATILQSLKNMEGVGFVYSRFVVVGAFLLALALEANGYSPYGRTTGFLVNGIQSEGGLQCALCPHRQADHDDTKHGTFVPAKYVLLTGLKDISPNNAGVIAAERAYTTMCTYK
jgi:hypothetical protein